MRSSGDTIHINGIIYTQKNFETLLQNLGNSEPWVLAIAQFLKEWFNDLDYIFSQTSGSTGTPKQIKIEKNKMVESAKLTISFFGLQKDQTALLCLPCEYIGGKMMIVRSIVAGLKLKVIKPSVNPFLNLEEDAQIDFSAFTPMQMQNALQSEQRQKINNLKIIILGGAPLAYQTENLLQNITSQIYETYGMTETISHIALRKINGENKASYFKALKGIQLGQDDRDCLTIYAPKLIVAPIVTNDLVEFVDINGFKWLGRVDNIINSGGIKIIPEVIEEKVNTIYNKPFFIAGITDTMLGQKVVMIIEGEKLDHVTELLLIKMLKEILPKNQSPKEIFAIPFVVRTENGKIKRKETLKQLFLQ
jgi:o-succinylbenzoate---CoA ligase